MDGSRIALLLLAAVVAAGVALASPNNVNGPTSSSSPPPSPTPNPYPSETATTTEDQAPMAKAGTKLSFDHVEAEYASRFLVRMDNASQGGWGRDLAGDDGLLNVTYGILRFWSDDEPTGVGGASFLKVEGPNGSRRFLGNSGSWTYWNDTYPGVVRTAKLEFTTSTQVANGSLVTDFTPPVLSVHLWRSFNETDGHLDELMVATWDDWDAGFDEFWKGRPVHNTWTLVPGSLVDAGEPTVGVNP